MTAYQVYLNWNSTLLNVTEVAESIFLSNNSMYPTFFTYRNNNSQGMLQVWGAQLAGNNSTTMGGNGTLFTVIFLAKNIGQCMLEVSATEIMLVTTPIAHLAEDGFVDIAGPDDVAVDGIFPYKNLVVEGFTMDGTVTVENRGINTETFNLTLS